MEKEEEEEKEKEEKKKEVESIYTPSFVAFQNTPAIAKHLSQFNDHLSICMSWRNVSSEGRRKKRKKKRGKKTKNKKKKKKILRMTLKYYWEIKNSNLISNNSKLNKKFATFLYTTINNLFIYFEGFRNNI